MLSPVPDAELRAADHSPGGVVTEAIGAPGHLGTLSAPLRLRERLSREMIAQLLTALAAVGVGLAGLLAGWLNVRLRLGIESQDRFVIFVSLAGAALFFAIRAVDDRAAEPFRPRHRAFLRDLRALAIAATLFFALTFVGRVEDLFPRGWILSWLGLGGLALCLVRFALVGMAVPVLAGLMRRRVALVGSTGMIEDVRRLLARSGEEVELVAAVPVCGEEDLEGKLVRLREATVDAGIDEVVLCLPLADAGRVRRAVDLLLAVPAEVSLFADRAGLELAEHGLATAGRFPRMRLLERPVRDWGRIAKGLMDRVGAVVLLVLLSPLFAVIALAIRLDSPGPVFYRQLRRGLGGRPFEMLKFRSMYADRCDAPDAPIRQARRDDPRFTRVGRFLRRTSLDELPQLWNVLRGEMSLVGPRPHPIRMDDSYAEEIALYLGRHRLKPGITGWAQIHGFRGETPTLEAIRARIDHDLYYIRNWSLGLDLWILLLTPWKLLTCRNAY